MVIPTQEEVWNTLKGMGSLKSPGPDGMPPIFYKKYWDKVGNEGLSWIIRKMEASTLYNGYRVNIWAPSISHLMFADDLFFFSTLDDRTLQSLQDILFIYARWSGQQANLDKSAILFSKGVGEDRRQSISDMLGVKQMESNDKYLGFQLLKSAHRIKSYEFLHEKFDNKLVGWKRIFP